jgi:chromosome segregation ATPase
MAAKTETISTLSTKIEELAIQIIGRREQKKALGAQLEAVAQEEASLEKQKAELEKQRTEFVALEAAEKAKQEAERKRLEAEQAKHLEELKGYRRTAQCHYSGLTATQQGQLRGIFGIIDVTSCSDNAPAHYSKAVKDCTNLETLREASEFVTFLIQQKK